MMGTGYFSAAPPADSREGDASPKSSLSPFHLMNAQQCGIP